LTLGETAAYIRHRLEKSGAQATIFDSGAIDEIFIFSGGYPRLINIMCDHALLTGYVQEVRVIGAGLIRECWKELVVSKKTSEADFKYPGEDQRPRPKETIPDEPPDVPIIPKEDPKPREAVQAKFRPEPRMTKPVRTRRPVKKRFFQSPIVIAFVLIVGIVAGYLLYGNDKDDAASLVDLAQKQIGQHFNMKGEPIDNERTMVPSGSETSDTSGPVGTGKVEDFRFFDDMPPNSNSYEGTLPKGDGSFHPVPPGRFGEETVKPPLSVKPDEPGPAGNTKTTETGKTAVPGALPDANKRAPVVIPRQADKEDTVQIPASKPAQTPEKPKTPELAKEANAAPVKKPETVEPVTKSVQALKEPPEKYPAEPEFQKKKEPASPKSVSTEKKSPLPSPAPSKRRPEPPVVSKAEVPKVEENAARKKAQPAVPDKTGVAGRADGRVVSSIGTMGKPETKNNAASLKRDLQTRLKAFLTEYSRTYAKKDLDKLSTYFASNAVEKGQPFRSRIPQYRQNFDRIDEIEYAIGLDRYAVQEESGLVKIEGTFQVTARFAGSRELRKNTGQISMVLVSDGNSFKIIQLDY